MSDEQRMPPADLSQDSPRDWWIAVGNNSNWGRAKSPEAALRNMRREGGRKKTTAWTLYNVHETTVVNGMGGLNWFTAGPEPVIVKRRNNMKGSPS